MGGTCCACSNEIVLDQQTITRLKKKIAVKMAKAGQTKAFCNDFVEGPYSQLLKSKEIGRIFEAEVSPLTDVPRYADLILSDASSLKKVVIIKLNGGLGASMCLSSPKSLIPVDGDLTFLDCAVRQYKNLPDYQRGEFRLLNSSATTHATMRFLDRSSYNLGDRELLQNKMPKIDKCTYDAVTHKDPDLEWAPPGSGDVFSTLTRGSACKKLIEQGYEYAFISNVDNLGAVVDEKIMFHVMQSKKAMIMEVCERIPSNSSKENGHLCMFDNRLKIRQEDEVYDPEIHFFEDIDVYKYFDAGNYWVNLKELQQLADENRLRFPLRKKISRVNPADISADEVILPEINAGDAISLFPNAGVLAVPSERHLPVRTIEDLFVLRSNAYTFEDDVPHLSHFYAVKPRVELDRRHYKTEADLKNMCPDGLPSLGECESLKVIGKIMFMAKTVVRGKVVIINTTNKVIEMRGSLVNETFKY